MTNRNIIAHLRASIAWYADREKSLLIRAEQAERKLLNLVVTYDRENPIRTADAHPHDCLCLRCAIDNLRDNTRIK